MLLPLIKFSILKIGNLIKNFSVFFVFNFDKQEYGHMAAIAAWVWREHSQCSNRYHIMRQPSFLSVILVHSPYLKNYLEYSRSVWSAKKFFFFFFVSFFQIKYWKHLHDLKAALKRILMFENAFNLRGFGANNFNFSPNVHQMRICERHSTRHQSKLSCAELTPI